MFGPRLLILFITLSAFGLKAQESCHQSLKNLLRTTPPISIGPATSKEVIAQIKEGDQVVFSNGARFDIVGFLGQGQSTRIFDIGQGKALRIPLGFGPVFDWRNDLQYPDFITYFLETQKQLKRRGVPVVKVYDFFENQYVVVQKVDIAFKLSDLEIAPNEFDWSRISQFGLDPQFVIEKYKEFAIKTWPFQRIGDLNSTQLVYTRQKQWIILDAGIGTQTSRLKASSPGEMQSVFSEQNPPDWLIQMGFGWAPIQLPLPASIEDEVLTEIYRKRTQR